MTGGSKEGFVSGEAADIFLRAQELAEAGDSTGASALYRAAAEKGHPASAFMLGRMMAAGLCGSPEEGIFWTAYSASDGYIMARKVLEKMDSYPSDADILALSDGLAEAGSPAAMYASGMCRLLGIGTDIDAEGAYDFFRRSGAAGNADGACEEALCLMRGAGVRRDRPAGVAKLKALADGGCLRAALKYAECLEHGYGMPKDPAAAFRIYSDLAGRNEPLGEYNTGRCYMDGIGVRKDPYMAYSWYLVAQTMGAAEGDYGMARCMMGGVGTDRESKKGYELLLTAADRGCREAMVMAGQLCERGKIAKKSAEKALQFFLRAAETGSPYANLAAGDILSENGRDPRGAFACYLRGALLGNTQAMHMAGTALLSGLGVKKNEGKGFELCRMAAEDGFMKSQYTVANCYARGRGTKRNFKKALEMHTELAKKGYIKSMLYVGEAYYNGDGAPTDAAEGVKYLMMGAAKKDALCEYYMGDAYTTGRGVEKDPHKAEEWYKKAASHGHILSKKILDAKGISYGGQVRESPFDSFLRKAKSGDAQSMYIVGRYYEDGIGIDKDIAQAKVWYGSAAKKGNEAAKRALDDIRAKEQ